MQAAWPVFLTLLKNDRLYELRKLRNVERCYELYMNREGMDRFGLSVYISGIYHELLRKTTMCLKDGTWTGFE
jgi:hypothetical protein